MDCTTVPCGGGLVVETLPDLPSCSFRKKLFSKVAYLELRACRRWVCSASAAGKVALLNVTQEVAKDKWLLQIKNCLREGKVWEAEVLLRKMTDVGLVPDLPVYNALITAHGKAGRFASAQAWFFLLEAEPWLKPDAITYRSMIGACGRAGELEEALKLYDRLKACGFRPTNQTFNTLISLHRKADKHAKIEEKVLSLLADMREMVCCPDSSTLDVVVRLYEKLGILENLSAAISVLEAAGWSPTRRCHGILVKAYIRCGLADRALNAFQDMCGNPKIGPASSAKNQVVQENTNLAFLDQKQVNKKSQLPLEISQRQVPNRVLVRVYDAHECNGYSRLGSTTCRLDESLCHSLILFCKSLGRYREALYVFDEMRRSGTNPSWYTASTVIDICGRLNVASAAERGDSLFMEMRSSVTGRQSTDVGAYTATINMFLKAGMAQRAAEISTLVTEHEGLVPDSALFLAMLRAYSRSGIPAKAVQVYKRMLGVRLTWTAAMFNGVLHCCGRALPLEESIKVFLAMVYSKLPLSTITCNLMMDIFAKAGLLEKAENVFKLAKEQRVVDAISYNTLIAAYGRYKEFNLMEHTLLDMQNAGFKDHVEAYNSMLDAYGKASQLSRMESTLERMKRADCQPDLSTYNTLINVYGREGLIWEVQKMRKAMRDAEIQPDVYTFNTLIFAYGNAEMPNEAMAAFKEMQDSGLVPDEVTYNCLIAAFERGGNHLEAARWSIWMTQLGMK